VCIRHFENCDTIPGKKISLKPEAVPKIFDSEARCNSVAFADFDVEVPTSSGINENEFNSSKVAELEKLIKTMVANHNVEVQRLQQKVNSLENKNKKRTDELKMAKKEVVKEKNKSNDLRAVIDELRQKKYISPDDEKFLNVRKMNCINYLI